MAFPATFVAIYLLLLVALLVAAYQLYTRFRAMPEELTPEELAQQRARDAAIAAAHPSNGPTTRQLISQTLMQAWRMGGTTAATDNTVDADDEITALRNQRLELMRKNLKYTIIGESQVDDTSCAVDEQDKDVEKGADQQQQQQQPQPPPSDTCKPCDTRKECPICLDVYNHGEKMAIPISNGCGHAFHDECITLWLLQHDHCPLCRTRLLDIPVAQ
jgi:hypothetical protein